MNFKQEIVVSVLFSSSNRDKNSGQPFQLKLFFSGLFIQGLFQLNMIHSTVKKLGHGLEHVRKKSDFDLSLSFYSGF